MLVSVEQEEYLDKYFSIADPGVPLQWVEHRPELYDRYTFLKNSINRDMGLPEQNNMNTPEGFALSMCFIAGSWVLGEVQKDNQQDEIPANVTITGQMDWYGALGVNQDPTARMDHASRIGEQFVSASRAWFSMTQDYPRIVRASTERLVQGAADMGIHESYLAITRMAEEDYLRKI